MIKNGWYAIKPKTKLFCYIFVIVNFYLHFSSFITQFDEMCYPKLKSLFWSHKVFFLIITLFSGI